MVLLPLSPEDEVRRFRLQQSIDESRPPKQVPPVKPKVPHFTVVLPYPGSAISINRSHFKRGPLGGALTSEARAWMNGAVLIIRAAGNTAGFPWGPMKMTLSGRFRTKRSMPDWDNILKPVKDALAAAAGVNDNAILSVQGDWAVGSDGEGPYLTLEVTIWRA